MENVDFSPRVSMRLSPSAPLLQATHGPWVLSVQFCAPAAELCRLHCLQGEAPLAFPVLLGKSVTDKSH